MNKNYDWESMFKKIKLKDLQNLNNSNTTVSQSINNFS